MSRTCPRCGPPSSRIGGALVLTLSTIAAAAGAAPAQDGNEAARAPATGRYTATLCVSNAAQAPSCGPAEAEVHRGGAVDVRVSDIVYRLAVSGHTSIVVVTQGQMMIDAFDTGPQWSGRSLNFVDAEKQVHYQVELGTRHAERR